MRWNRKIRHFFLFHFILFSNEEWKKSSHKLTLNCFSLKFLLLRFSLHTIHIKLNVNVYTAHSFRVSLVQHAISEISITFSIGIIKLSDINNALRSMWIYSFNTSYVHTVFGIAFAFTFEHTVQHRFYQQIIEKGNSIILYAEE